MPKMGICGRYRPPGGFKLLGSYRCLSNGPSTPVGLQDVQERVFVHYMSYFGQIWAILTLFLGYRSTSNMCTNVGSEQGTCENTAKKPKK